MLVRRRRIDDTAGARFTARRLAAERAAGMLWVVFDAPSRMIDFLAGLSGTFLFSLAQAAPYIVIGLLVAGAIREFVPAHVLGRHFGERGFAPVAKATGIGALVPTCSCGVIPIGVGAFHAGAARGTTLAFLVAAPTLSPVAVILGLQMLGESLVVSLVAGVMVGAFVLGVVANRWLGGAHEAEFRRARGIVPAGTCGIGADADAPASRLRRMFRWSVLDFGPKLGAQLTVGLLLAALILTLVPVDWVHGWLGVQSVWSILIVLLVAIPIYTCSVPSIAVAYSLLLLGISPGAAVAFLIAGPATNVAELNAVRGQLGMAAAGLYLAGLIAIAIGAGVATDRLVFPDYEYRWSEVGGELVIEACCVPFADSAAAVSHSPMESLSKVPAWHLPFLVGLAPVLALGIVRHIRTWRPRVAPGSSNAAGDATCCPKNTCCDAPSGHPDRDHVCDSESSRERGSPSWPRYRPESSDDTPREER